MTANSRYIYALSFAIAGIGFLMPFWPLCVLGVLVAALSGRYIFAVILGLLLDIGSGMPTGIWQYVLVPFTMLALVASVLRALGGTYFLDKTPPDRI